MNHLSGKNLCIILGAGLLSASLLAGCGNTANQISDPAAATATESNEVTDSTETAAEAEAASSVNPEGEEDISGNDPAATGDVSGNDPAGFTKTSWKESHEKVKGIYVTGPMAGSSGMDDLIQLIDDTELNAVVIDIKDDNGNITFLSDNETLSQLGVCTNYIRDLDGLMTKLKEHGIYTIARVVCFKDPTLASVRPELALKTSSGTPITDGNGLAWVNPCNEEVWDYLAMIGCLCKELGFDEVQYDYVRFPVGKEAGAADYGVEISGDTKHTYIEGFLTHAAGKLHEVDMPVTADVFGTIIGSPVDVASVGQDYVNLSTVLDAICPMIYPSHYGPGVFGFDVPDAHPYETILAALTDSTEELAEVPAEECAVIRPWLQSFTAKWVDGHITYDGAAVRKEIQAVQDAGYEEWILWNASNRYPKEF